MMSLEFCMEMPFGEGSARTRFEVFFELVSEVFVWKGDACY